MPQICDNTWFQTVGEPASVSLAQAVADRSVRRYVHLCQPYQNAQAEAELLAQKVTYAAMQHARQVAKSSGIDVEFLGAAFPADEPYAAQYFDRTFHLKRTSRNVKSFGTERSLPLLFDILTGAANCGADYVIFTNVDICPVPHFYCTVDALLARGCDALVINRRILEGWPEDPDLVDLMAADPGSPHRGYDCFVFRRAALTHFVANTAIIGAGGVMQSLIYNLVATSQRLLILGDVHLTWHLGDEHPWKAPHLRDYIEHNWTEAITTLRTLAAAQPQRFAEFCRNFAVSRVDVEKLGNGSIGLRRKEDCNAFIPDLEAINRHV